MKATLAFEKTLICGYEYPYSVKYASSDLNE